MMSQLSGETILPMANTKTKRDEFLIEIRKSKNKTILQKKRMKLDLNEQDGKDLPMQEETTCESNMSTNEQQAPVQSASEIQATLQESYDKFFDVLNRQEWDELLPIVKFFRDLIGDQPSVVSGKTVIEMGIVPHLLSLLSSNFSKYKELQIEIAWLLANISAGTSEDTTYLVEQNVIPIFSDCLKSTINEDLQENAMWTLANISGENNLSYRDQIIQLGVLNQVVRELCKTQKRTLYYRTAAWLISNLVRGRPFPSYDKVSKVFTALTHLISYPDETIQQHTLLSLSYLTEEVKETNIKSITNNNLIPKIVNYISHKDERIAINAVRTTGNLALGSKKWTHNLCEHEIYKAMPEVLSSPNNILRREGCMTLSNIFNNNFDDHTYIIDFNLITLLVNLALNDEIETKIVATQCLFKFLLNCSLEEAMVPIEKGLVEVLLQNMTFNNVKLIENSVMTLYKVFEHGEGLKKQNEGYNPFVMRIVQSNAVNIIEALQFHNDEDILTKVNLLLDKFCRSCPY